MTVDLAAANEAAEFFGVAGKTGLWRTVQARPGADGNTLSVLLERDVESYMQVHGNRDPSAKWIRRHEITIPFKLRMLTWRRVRGIRVAPSDQLVYDFDDKTGEGTGAQWAS